MKISDLFEHLKSTFAAPAPQSDPQADKKEIFYPFGTHAGGVYIATGRQHPPPQ